MSARPPDDDSNLTDDGRYAYVWDAENRLISMERKLPRATGDRRMAQHRQGKVPRTRPDQRADANW